MGRQRRQFSGEFEAKVALEAIKGQHTVREIAARYSVRPSVVKRWKRQANGRDWIDDQNEREAEQKRDKDHYWQVFPQAAERAWEALKAQLSANATKLK